MTRLFVAIDLPESVKERVSALCNGLPGAKWVKPAQIHVTLRFIGVVGDGQFTAIRQALGAIEATPFEMRLSGIGQFPQKGAPRVLWAGIEASNGLFQLQEQVEQAVRSTGSDAPDHPFSAHLTLARFKTPPEAAFFKTYLDRNKAFQTEMFEVRQFVLFSSLLQPEGSVYRYEDLYSPHTK